MRDPAHESIQSSSRNDNECKTHAQHIHTNGQLRYVHDYFSTCTRALDLRAYVVGVCARFFWVGCVRCCVTFCVLSVALRRPWTTDHFRTRRISKAVCRSGARSGQNCFSIRLNTRSCWNKPLPKRDFPLRYEPACTT